MEIFDNTLSHRKLIISNKVMSYYRKLISSYDFSVEIGGILVGELKPLNDAVVITDISEPFPNDIGGDLFFKRKSAGHQEYMDKLWRESCNRKMYLGEWHTHNQKVPYPSSIDISNWKTIIHNNNVAPELYFIIVGTQRLLIWNAYNGVISQMDIGDPLVWKEYIY
jgi:integrative and conjugative element protein (TIGR02256 family)